MAAMRLSPTAAASGANGLAISARMERQPEALRVRHHLCEHGAQQALGQRPAVRALDVGAGMVDQVHVVDAGRTGRHAGEAGQAAVDMSGDLLRRRPVVLQHVLDQVDAPARRIELIAVEHIGRAGRGAKAAVHAGAQDLFRFRDMRVGQLREGEGGLHVLNTRPHASGIEHALRIEALPHALRQCGKRGRLRLEHVDLGAERCRRANERRVAAGRGRRWIARWTRRASSEDGNAGPDRPPAQSYMISASRSLDKRAPDFGAARRRRRDAPDDRAPPARPRRAANGARARGIARHNAARRDASVRACRVRRKAPSSLSSNALAMRDRWRDAFEPERRYGRPAPSDFGDARGGRGRQMRRRRDIGSRAHDSRHGFAGGRIVEVRAPARFLRFRPAAAS